MPIFRKDGRNILFIHIPKTGGSAIERAFKDVGYETSYLDGKAGRESLNYLRRCSPQHMHGAMLRQNFRLKRFDLIFMIVRDPIARFRSEYLWRLRSEELDVGPDSVDAWARSAFEGFERDTYVFDNHFRPQADFLVPGAKVYRFENGLDTVVTDLNATYELGLNPELPRVREGNAVTNFSSRDVVIPPNLEAELKQFYRRDYDRFDYGHVKRTFASFMADGPGKLAKRVRRVLG